MRWIDIHLSYNFGDDFETKVFFNGKETEFQTNSTWNILYPRNRIMPGDRIEVVVFDTDNYDPWVSGNPYKTKNDWKSALDNFAPYFEDRYIIDLLAAFVNPVVAKLTIICHPTSDPARKYEAIRTAEARSWREDKMKKIIDMVEYLGEEEEF